MSSNKRECRGRWSPNSPSDNSLHDNVYQLAGVKKVAVYCWGVVNPP
ncbi:MAG: hypothetical protein ACXWPS_21990 [Ktedonobacteraceae bacterium]